jgi:hypothetical protein
MSRVKWDESEEGVQSSDRILRMMVGVVVCVVFLGYAAVGIIQLGKAEILMPNFMSYFKELGESLMMYAWPILLVIGGWKAVSNITEKFDEPKKE